MQFQALYVGPNIVEENNEIRVIKEDSSYHKTYYDYKNWSAQGQHLDHVFCITETIGEYSRNTFKNHLKKIYEYYLASDIVVMPSIYETFGYCALEAMSCQRSVVASNISGLKELLGDGRGTLIDIELSLDQTSINLTAERFAKAIKSILEQGAQHQVQMAKEWVDKRYSKEKMKNLIDNMYSTYLESIVQSWRLSNDDANIFNSILNREFNNIEDWNTLLKKSEGVYQALRKEFYPSSKSTSEFYNLFWNIAYWLKMNKSLCPEIRRVSVKELAHIITSVTRFTPKPLYPSSQQS